MDIIVKKKIYIAWPKILAWAIHHPCNFTKKLFVQVICCYPYLKFSWHGLFLAKRIKTKGSCIVGHKNFYHSLLEIETEETVVKKIK